MVLQYRHEVAIGAGVPQVDALAELRAPIGGLRDNLVAHGAEGLQDGDGRRLLALDEGKRVGELAPVEVAPAPLALVLPAVLVPTARPE
eukprot:1085862-Lingulodinium_polyedra.AAC.1